jgi:electron transport complex protein RnfB
MMSKKMTGTSDGEQVYRDLQRRLDKMPVGFPETASGVEIRILKHLFSPLEALVAKYLSITPEPLSRIHKRLKDEGLSIEQVEKALEGAAAKGSILMRKKDDKKLYSLMPLIFGMYEFQVDRQTPEFARDITLYGKGEFGDELYRTKIPQLRTIPVRESIALHEKYRISTYDDLKSILEKAGERIAVINCICRQTREKIGEKCSKTDLRQTCFVFGEMSESVVKGGIGRAVTEEEALAIIARARADGLVVQPENTQDPSYVCCCCGDCCGILSTIKRFSSPAEMCAGNYQAEIDPDSCTGCGLCVKHCQMEAIRIEADVAVVDLDRCIGCGNCAAICEFESPILHRRHETFIPPKDTVALHMKIMSRKFGRSGVLKAGAKMVLKQQV